MSRETSTITITRSRVFNGVGTRHPFRWSYECTGPDGGRWQDNAIVTLRRNLKRRYGRGVVLVEQWDKSEPLFTGRPI